MELLVCNPGCDFSNVLTMIIEISLGVTAAMIFFLKQKKQGDLIHKLLISDELNQAHRKNSALQRFVILFNTINDPLSNILTIGKRLGNDYEHSDNTTLKQSIQDLKNHRLELINLKNSVSDAIGLHLGTKVDDICNLSESIINSISKESNRVVPEENIRKVNSDIQEILVHLKGELYDASQLLMKLQKSEQNQTAIDQKVAGLSP